MKKFYSRKLLPNQPVHKALLRQLEDYLNSRLPTFLQLNVEKGRPDPLRDSMLITTHKEFISEGYLSIGDYKPAMFDEEVKEVTFELSHYSKFNYHGQKIIVLIMRFNLEMSSCDFSIALFDEDAKRKVQVIEKELLALLQQHKKTGTRIKQLHPTAIE